MALFLVQHGKSLPKEEDPERHLSNDGVSDVRRIAEVARNYKVRVTTIFHSEKIRARQTADIIADILSPTKGTQERASLKPMDDVVACAKWMNPVDNIMIVGHLPFLEKLTSYLITGTTDVRVFAFQNGGIVCLDKDDEHLNWYIKWALMPEVKS